MTVRIREPRGHWEWRAAVDELVLEDGVQATAHAWALHCVTWKGDACQPRTPHVGVEELARRRRRDRTAVRRHLRTLQELGLLELVQRHGHGKKQLYRARVPAEYGAPGDPLPLPGLEVNGYRAPAPGNPGLITGRQRTPLPGASAPPYRAPAPGSPSLQSSQTSSRAPCADVPGSSARLQGQEEEPNPEDVLDRLRAKVPAVMDQTDVATRRRMAARIRTLLHDVGWQPDELTQELTRSTFNGTRSPVGTLMTRLDGMVAAGGDELARLHAEQSARDARREQQRQQRGIGDEHDREQRAASEQWAANLAMAMPADELAELLVLVLAEHHPQLSVRASAARNAVARGWLRDEYEAAGDGQPLPEFLAEMRDKLAREPDHANLAVAAGPHRP